MALVLTNPAEMGRTAVGVAIAIGTEGITVLGSQSNQTRAVSTARPVRGLPNRLPVLFRAQGQIGAAVVADALIDVFVLSISTLAFTEAVSKVGS